MDLSKIIQTFLMKNKGPFLLGYSGGPDSKALLYLLMEEKAVFEVAHIDHGWRASSKQEAMQLQKEVESFGIAFHSCRLPLKLSENDARKARLQFFQKICKARLLKGILLAHTRDDQAETVLKRIFEGAHLIHLGCMKEKGSLDDLMVYRPLLDVAKQQLFQFLEMRDASYIDDETNRDSKYLRARMREKLIPYLTELFGKEIQGNLNLLTKRAKEFNDYLDEKIAPYLKTIHQTPYGLFIKMPDIHRLEQKHLLMRVAKMRSCTFKRQQLEDLLDWIETKKSHVKLILENEVYLYRGIVGFLSKASSGNQIKNLLQTLFV